MWTIIKYKSQELQTAKKNLILKFEDKPIFYLPKIKYQKIINKKVKSFEKNILENYMICFHKNFSDANFITRLKNLRGISYFLSGYQNNQNDILVFVKSNKKAILKKLKKRPGFNYKLFIKFKKIQLPLDYKMKKSHFIIKNNFTNKSVKRDIKYILKRIL